MRVVVLGAGSWGTALAILLARNGAEVHLAGRDLDEIDTMRLRRENARYLPGFALPAEVRVIPLADSPADADLAVIAVPAKAVREICAFVAPSATILVSSKGLEAGSGAILTEVVAEAVPGAEVGVISGPNLAVELVRGIPTVAVVAFPREETAERVRGAFMSRTYRVYIGSDIVGVELAGALKNVLAIGAGMIDGLGYGDNTKGAMLARGLHEMACLGVHMGARLETFFGIAGVGDLFATANSRLSRNYRVGLGLG
jgi:glycerol-3-phosphate dehydrogenase (NAD(P)+)